MNLSSRPTANPAPQGDKITTVMDAIARAKPYLNRVEDAVNVVRGVLCGVGISNFWVTASGFGVDIMMKVDDSSDWVYLQVN
jgi:DNA primase